MKVSTSILSAKDLNKCLKELNNTDTDYIHLDIMDGKFVTNKTWHLDDLNLDDITKPIDVHLMVYDVINYVNEFSFINPEYITFHVEAIDNVKETISYIKSLGIKVGISIKPNTKVSEIYEYLPLIDLVLVMSVEPGLGGQEFIESSKEKIDELKDFKIKNNLNYLISVDGGINDETVNLAKNADMVVAGSFILKSDIEKNIEVLKSI